MFVSVSGRRSTRGGGLFFSNAGKEILIKAVLQAIPSYVASCFRIPQGLVDDIHRAMASFWWGGSSESEENPLVEMDGAHGP